jgi:hypothetical protein
MGGRTGLNRTLATLDAVAAERRRILEAEAKAEAEAAKRLQAETGTWLADKETKN